MLPTEVNILKRIHLDGKWPFALEQTYDIPGVYISYLINSFVKRGLIKGKWSSGFRLTAMGKNRILAA